MLNDEYPGPTSQYVELGRLLGNTIGAVVEAQEKLDKYTLARKHAYETAEEGDLALPPLWYLFNNVSIELELSAQVGNAVPTARQGIENGKAEPHLFCRTLNPTSVSLYGYQASAGMKIRVMMSPQGSLPVKYEGEQNNNGSSEEKNG